MAQLFITKKISNGKMVKIKVAFDTCILSIQILGDFFLHPEETISKIESALIGLDTNAPPHVFTQKIETALQDSNAQLIGVTPAEISLVLSEALAHG